MKVPPAITRLAGRTAELVDLLESWANINSGSGHAAGLARMRTVLKEAFCRSFPEAQIEEPALECADGRALRITLRPAARARVLLSGHFDTVYEADHPFQRCTRPDARTLRGPGVIDMKGGLVLLLAALEAVEGSPEAAGLGWEVLLTPDEESGSHGSRALLAEAACRHRFALVFEPARANGDLVHSRKGTGNLVVTAHGRAAHAAQVPNPGRNAILALAEFLLEAARTPASLPGVLLNVGHCRGGGPATNVVPDFAQAEVDVRISRAQDQSLLGDHLRALAARFTDREGLQLELDLRFDRPPKECRPAEQAAFLLWRQAAADLGLPPPAWVHTGGGSDGNILSDAGLPCLDGLGPVGDHLHSDQEFIRTDSLAPRAQVAALFLHRLAAGAINV